MNWPESRKNVAINIQDSPSKVINTAQLLSESERYSTDKIHSLTHTQQTYIHETYPLCPAI
jgi:hypothetical protein